MAARLRHVTPSFAVHSNGSLPTMIQHPITPSHFAHLLRSPDQDIGTPLSSIQENHLEDSDLTEEPFEELFCLCNDYHGCDANNSCSVNAAAGDKCFHMAELVDEESPASGGRSIAEQHLFGCTHQTTEFTCKGAKVPHFVPKHIECCSTGHYCNADLEVKLNAVDTRHNEDGVLNSLSVSPLSLAFFGVASIALVLVLVIAVYYFKRHFRLRKDRRASYCSDGDLSELYFNQDSSSVGAKYFEDSTGSGSGVPLLIQKTIAREVQRVKQIAQGRYGTVYKARWKNDFVALKIFHTLDEHSWKRESEIYQTVMLNHENILRCIAADIFGNGATTEMMLITDYYEQGSLYDFLKANKISISQVLSLAQTAVKGLAELHSSITTSNLAKPAIAHRDIKSKNVLVKNSNTSVLSDFGLAVKDSRGKVDIKKENPRVGTKRYMAPEVLESRQNAEHWSFDQFTQADMYAFGLVMWEIASRCSEFSDTTPHYRLPYEEYNVPVDPSVEHMRKLVAIEGKRPTFPESNHKDFIMQTYVSLCEECWRPKASARLTSLRVQKDLKELQLAWSDHKKLMRSQKAQISQTTSAVVQQQQPYSQENGSFHAVHQTQLLLDSQCNPPQISLLDGTSTQLFDDEGSLLPPMSPIQQSEEEHQTNPAFPSPAPIHTGRNQETSSSCNASNSAVDSVPPKIVHNYLGPSRFSYAHHNNRASSGDPDSGMPVTGSTTC